MLIIDLDVIIKAQKNDPTCQFFDCNSKDNPYTSYDLCLDRYHSCPSILDSNSHFILAFSYPISPNRTGIKASPKILSPFQDGRR